MLGKTLDTIKQSEIRVTQRTPDSVTIQEIFDERTTAHNDLHRNRGFSPWQLLLGKTPTDKSVCENPDLAQRSVEVVDQAAKQRLGVKKESYKAYIEEELSLRKRRKEIHQARPWRHWAAGERCWYWRSGEHKSSRMKGGVFFFGLARVLLQERETTAGGVRVKGVVWITKGTSLVRCAGQHLRSLSESEKDCAVSQTQTPSVSKTLSDVCHTAHFLISRHRQMLLMMLGKKKSLVGTHEAHEIQAVAVSFWPRQPDATSRLGPDLVPPSRQVRTDDEVSVQEHETTHVPFTHPSASDTIPSDVPVTSVEPEDSVQTTSMRRIRFKRPPNPLDRVEPPKRTNGDDDDHSALLSAYHHDLEKASENFKDGKSVVSGIVMLDMSDSAWLAIKIKAETQKGETTTEAESLELLQKDVDNLLVTVSYSLDEETIQQISSNPDPETAFIVIVKRRRAEVKVSTLSAEQKRELVEAKDKELNTFVKYSLVEAASRPGSSPSVLMKMRWVVTFKDDGSLKARLVVQGFTDQRLGKIPTSSPTAPRRSRQIFLTLAASLGFQTHKGDVKCAFLQGDLDEQHADDDDDDNFKIESAQPVSDTFCEPVPELSRKLQLEHHQCVRLLKAVYGLVNAPRGSSIMEPCLWTFRDANGVIHALCSEYVDEFMLACSDSPFGNKSLIALAICTNGESGVTSVQTVRRTNHTSLRQTHRNKGRI